jgi:hypothetical protein
MPVEDALEQLLLIANEQRLADSQVLALDEEASSHRVFRRLES